MDHPFAKEIKKVSIRDYRACKKPDPPVPPFPYRLQPYRLEESRPPLRAGRRLYMKVPNHLQTFSAPN